jgi:hypothetical protein
MKYLPCELGRGQARSPMRPPPRVTKLGAFPTRVHVLMCAETRQPVQRRRRGLGSPCWFAGAGGGGWVHRRVGSPEPEEKEARSVSASLLSLLGASMLEPGRSRKQRGITAEVLAEARLAHRGSSCSRGARRGAPRGREFLHSSSCTHPSPVRRNSSAGVNLPS